MKRLIALISLAVMINLLCACGVPAADAPAPATDDPTIELDTEYIEGGALEEIDETEPEMMGEFTLADVEKIMKSGNPRFLIRYPDNSFDFYRAGVALDWGIPELYTYGTERNCFNLKMLISEDNENMAKLAKGELVFVSNQASHVYANIYPVIESGYAMSGKNPEGYSNTLLWKSETGSSFDYMDYGYAEERRKISHINGISVGEENIFEKDEDNKYVTLNEGDTYMIGEVVGTKLYESEYCVNSVYYLHTYYPYYNLYDYEEDVYSFDLKPTTDGYAVVDLSELPCGDYVIMYTYWDEEYNKRNECTTHIRID